MNLNINCPLHSKKIQFVCIFEHCQANQRQGCHYCLNEHSPHIKFLLEVREQLIKSEFQFEIFYDQSIEQIKKASKKMLQEKPKQNYQQIRNEILNEIDKSYNDLTKRVISQVLKLKKEMTIARYENLKQEIQEEEMIKAINHNEFKENLLRIQQKEAQEWQFPEWRFLYNIYKNGDKLIQDLQMKNIDLERCCSVCKSFGSRTQQQFISIEVLAQSLQSQTEKLIFNKYELVQENEQEKEESNFLEFDDNDMQDKLDTSMININYKPHDNTLSLDDEKLEEIKQVPQASLEESFQVQPQEIDLIFNKYFEKKLIVKQTSKPIQIIAIQQNFYETRAYEDQRSIKLMTQLIEKRFTKTVLKKYQKIIAKDSYLNQQLEQNNSIISLINILLVNPAKTVFFMWANKLIDWIFNENSFNFYKELKLQFQSLRRKEELIKYVQGLKTSIQNFFYPQFIFVDELGYQKDSGIWQFQHIQTINKVDRMLSKKFQTFSDLEWRIYYLTKQRYIKVSQIYEEIKFIFEGLKESDVKVIQWSIYLDEFSYQKNLRECVNSWIQLCLWIQNYKEIPYNLIDMDQLLIGLISNFDNFIKVIDQIFSIKL